MTVKVLVTLNVEPCDPDDYLGSTGEFQAAAVEAVQNAVGYFQGVGFVHGLENDVSITVAEVWLVEEGE
jgi:hypothetical protein